MWWSSRVDDEVCSEGRVLTGLNASDASVEPSAVCYSNSYTTTTLSRNTWDSTELQVVRGRCSSQPGGLRWPPGAQVHTHRQLQYRDAHFPTMQPHEIPGVGSQTGQPNNTHFNMHTCAHTHTQHRRWGDDLRPSRISTKWYKVTGTRTRSSGKQIWSSWL